MATKCIKKGSTKQVATTNLIGGFMELILQTPIEELTPKLIAFNNNEIISQLKPQLELYKNTTYTENQIADAKADRAKLNKFKDAIDDERKRIKKYYNQPYTQFEQQVNEITQLIDETNKTIDSQIKNFENQKKMAKRTEIVEFWDANIGDLAELINIDNVFAEQWLNATYSMKKVQDDITNFITKVHQDLTVITSLNFKQETHLKDFYLKTFDLAATLQEKTRLEENEKKLAELSKRQAQVQPEPVKTTDDELKVVDFRIYATSTQLQLVKEFLIKNNIKYGKVPTNV